MKLNFSTLPFVRSSQTVSRDVTASTTNQLLSAQTPPNYSEVSRTNNMGTRGGMRLIGDQVTITMRKDYCLPEKISHRKRRQLDLDCDLKIPCSLEDLPPPSKLRKRVLLGASVSGRSKSYTNKKSTGLDITTHIAMLRRKHLAMSRSEYD